jgi:hypothetical protein
MSNSIGVKSIRADKLRPGDWIVFDNPRMNQRVVEVTSTREDEILVRHDYGNGGEPATSFYEVDEPLSVVRG